MSNAIINRQFSKLYKLTIALIISLSLLFSAVAVLTRAITNDDDMPIWDGSSSAPTKGSGTENDPYEISNGAQLHYVIASGGGDDKYYEITKDIYLNDITKIDTQNGKVAEGYNVNYWPYNSPFSGNVEGNGHVIYGLYYSDSSSQYFGYHGIGLFPRVNVGTTLNVTRLGIDDSYIKGKNGASAFVGAAGVTSNQSSNKTANVNISECYVGANVTISGNDAGAFRGLGRYSALTLKNSYSLATVIGKERYGLFSNVWDSSVNMSNTFNGAGPVTSDVKSSSVILNRVYQTQTSAYTDAITLTKANMQGKDVFTNEAKMPSLNSDGVFTATLGMPVITVFGVPEEQEPVIQVSKYWDGSQTIAPEKGDGTKESPYCISTAAQLAYVIKNGGEGKHYALENDIYLNDLDKINWSTGEGAENYQINSWFDNAPFSGYINGNGHTVYGLYFANDNAPSFGYSGVGLIPRVNRGDSVTIRALGVNNAYISGKNGASAFVGFAGSQSYSDATQGNASVIIDQCYVGEQVIISGNDVGAFRGGTYHSETYVSNSYTLATLQTTSTQGVFGNMWEAGAVITNCFNGNGTLSSENKLSSVFFINSYGTVASNYPEDTVTLTKEKMQGEDALTAEDKMPLLNTDSAFSATAAYPKLSVFEGKDGVSAAEQPGDVWTGIYSMSLDRGSGTEKDPYIIDTAAALAYVIKTSGLGGKYFKLTHDIYLNDISSKTWYLNQDNREWVATNGFKGHIDGNGHIVYGLWFPEDTDTVNAGLVSTFAAGSIKNLGVRNAQVCAKRYAGGIVGATSNGGAKFIDSCFTDETVYVTVYDKNCGAGGILGMANDMTNSENVSLTITNCYSKARLTAVDKERMGGIMGSSWRTPYSIKNCYSVGYPVFIAAQSGMITSAYWNYQPGAADNARDGKQISDYLSDNYSDTSAKLSGVYATCTPTVIVKNSSDMRGETAKKVMPRLDYTKFETVSGGTPKLKIFTSVSGQDIFSSKEADFFEEGIGTQADPFIIKTVKHLRYLVESPDTKGKYYKLGNDIYVNNTKDADWTKKNPEVWYSGWDKDRSFAGHLDGNGYSIHGLYYNEAPNPTPEQVEACYVPIGTGLFPFIDASASIRNLHIRDSYIKGQGCVGAFAGSILTGDSGERLSLVACSVDETVTLHGYTVGGLIGAGNKGVDLTYCYSIAKLTSDGAKNRINGLIGDIWAGGIDMLQCYTLNHPLAFGILSTINSAYTSVEAANAVCLKPQQMIGTSAKKNMPDFSWNTVWYVANGKTPQLKVVPYGAEEHFYDEGVKGRVWSGKLATKFAGGSGTASDPYLIETPEQLALLVANWNTEGKYYKLTADIKLNDTSNPNWKLNARQWFSGETLFRGYFDGDGHVVSGLYYKNTEKKEPDATGLFTRIGYDTVIKRVGVTQSEITSTGKGIAPCAGAIVGWIENWLSNKNPDKKPPVISECFADDTVRIEAGAAGGIVGGTPDRVDFENCFFTGELTGDNCGAMVGSAWGTAGPQFRNCYGSTTDRDPIGGGWTITSKNSTIKYTNVYVDGTTHSSDATMLSIMHMRGDSAKQYMSGLDFENIWQTCNDGSPVLRCFSDAKQYTCLREPSTVEISFATLGGEKCEPIRGVPGYTKITEDLLPVPKYYGYKFNGWYHHDSYGAPFELEVFPNYDISLYAQWEEIGFLVDFEDAVDPQYDLNDGVELYKPGAAKYNPKYIYSGYRALHTIPDADVAPVFLLSYTNTLEVGKEYEITVHIASDTSGASGKVDIIHTNYPDVNDETLGYQNGFEYSNLKKDEWKEYKFKFTANSPFVLIRTTSGSSLYFDDIHVVPTGNEGETGKLISSEPQETIGFFKILIVPVIIVSLTVVAVLIALTITIAIKTYRKRIR